ncbi:MAG: MarR family transcriptional regulator [Eubacteriales bacterium]|nr:MarR family transcriptional regulator [Eubacteriales bacterium]
MKKSLQTAITIRRFNRFYLPYFHLLTQKYLNSEYSVAEARILYEIYENKEISARDMVRKLYVDKSYLSRILKKFESKALIKREVSQDDSRMTVISLTKNGEALAEDLIMQSNRQIEKDIMEISESDLDKLTYHLEKIIEILDGERNEHC